MGQVNLAWTNETNVNIDFTQAVHRKVGEEGTWEATTLVVEPDTDTGEFAFKAVDNTVDAIENSADVEVSYKVVITGADDVTIESNIAVATVPGNLDSVNDLTATYQA